jgi:hypothetical protein
MVVHRFWEKHATAIFAFPAMIPNMLQKPAVFAFVGHYDHVLIDSVLNASQKLPHDFLAGGRNPIRTKRPLECGVFVCLRQLDSLHILADCNLTASA